MMGVKKSLAVAGLLASTIMMPLHAEEANAWENIKQTAANAADKTREVAGEVAERTREVAGDAVERSQEVGEDIANSKAWQKTKEVGNATAEAAKNGVNKAKGYVNSHACDKQDKLNCEAE